MLKKLLSGLLFAWLLSGCSTSQGTNDTASASPVDGVSLIKRHVPGKGEIGLAYSKYKLDNGLTVILHPDDSDPLVHVDVTYHVGSGREEYGKSGFAHFFEHMMFQGSRHVEDDEHFKLITEAGGSMNGTTNADRTNYYQTVPANQLEKVLWLESDRMGFLLEAVTQQKFEIQRDTVKNERAQSYDNQPYGLRDEKTSEALYPLKHPYSWSTIGYVEDLDRVSVNDLKQFFARWYGPNNAVLTLGGDLDETQTLRWVKKYFGSIPAGPAVEEPQPEPVALQEDRYLTLEDQIHLPLLQITFPTVYGRHEDEAALDVLADILGDGKTSLFYKNLVRDQIAVQAAVAHPCQELACEFQLIALANPASTPNLAKVNEVIQATLQEFEQRGVNQDDLARTKATIKSSIIFGLQSVSGKVSTLAANEVFYGEPDLLSEELARYTAVTADDVMGVYRRYIKNNGKVVLSIVPQGQTQLAVAEANYEFAERNPEVQVAGEPPILTPITDNFDRSITPISGANPIVNVPAFWQQSFDNGLRIMGHQSREVPIVNLLISLEGGPLLDPLDKAGLASLTAQMLNESAKGMSNEEMANALALLGSRISFSASGRYTQISVSSLAENLAQTLALLEKKLFQPAFLEDDFQRLKQRMQQSILQQQKSPAALAGQTVDTLLYGTDNRVSLPDEGTVNTLKNISLEDVKQFYQRYYSPAKSNLVVVGDVSQTELLSELGFLKQWQGSDYAIAPYQPFPVHHQSSIYLVDKPGSVQSVVRVFKRSLPYDALGEHFRTKLMNFPLGGMFNSRINLLLREEKGYTYGVSSTFAGGKTLGRFQVGMDVKIASTGEALQDLLGEIELYQQQGMTETELELMRKAYTQSEALSYETPYSKISFLRRMLSYQLASDFRQKQNGIIRSISKDELNALARKHLSTGSMQIVIVGDSEVIKPQLSSFERQVIDVNASP